MNEEGEFKTCVRCSVLKPLTSFYRDSKSKDKHHSYCKDCQRQNVRQWQEDNRSQYRKLMMNHYFTHKNDYMEYQRTYREDRTKALVHSRVPHNHLMPYPLESNCEFCVTSEDLIHHHPEYEYAEIYVTCCRSCHWWIHYG